MGNNIYYAVLIDHVLGTAELVNFPLINFCAVLLGETKDVEV